MGQLISYYFLRAIKDLRCWILFVVFTIFTLSDILIGISNQYEDRGYMAKYMTFLSGNTEGHIPQLALYVLLPVILLIGSACWQMQDESTGNIRSLLARCSRKEVFAGQLIAVGLINFITVIIPLLINWLVVTIVFSGNKVDPDIGTVATVDGPQVVKEVGFGWMEKHHHILTNFSYIIVFSLIVGCLAIGINCLSYWLKKWYQVAIVSFGLWIIACLIPYSIMYLFQPFALDTNIITKTITLAVYLCFILFCANLTAYKWKREEL